MHPANGAESFAKLYWFLSLQSLDNIEGSVIALECFFPLPVISELIAFLYKLVCIFNCVWCQTDHFERCIHLFGPVFQSLNYWFSDHCCTILIFFMQISIVNSHQLFTFLISGNINWSSTLVIINVVENCSFTDWIADIRMYKNEKWILWMSISCNC